MEERDYDQIETELLRSWGRRTMEAPSPTLLAWAIQSPEPIALEEMESEELERTRALIAAHWLMGEVLPSLLSATPELEPFAARVRSLPALEGTMDRRALQSLADALYDLVVEVRALSVEWARADFVWPVRAALRSMSASFLPVVALSDVTESVNRLMGEAIGAAQAAGVYEDLAARIEAQGREIAERVVATHPRRGA